MKGQGPFVGFCCVWGRRPTKGQRPLVGGGGGVGVGEGFGEAFVVGDDGVDASLLEHRFRDPPEI